MTRSFVIRRFLTINLLAALFLPNLSYAAVRLNLLAVNPREDTNQTVSIRQELPKEIRSGDVLETGGLKLDYSPESDLYYVYGEVELGPKETKTLQVILQDKWDIPLEELNTLREELIAELEPLKNTDQYNTAKMLSDNINAKLDAIVVSQNEAAGDIERRIGLSRVNRKLLSSLEGDISSLKYMAERTTQLTKADTIKYIIESSNPANETAELLVSQYLPKGVQPEYLVSTADLEVGYDNIKNQYYLSKKDKFGPNETKRYEIEIKDVWFLPDTLLAQYQDEVEKLILILKETKYKALANSLKDSIAEYTRQIKESQVSATGLKERMALSHENEKRELKIKQSLDKLNSLVTDVVGSKGFFTVLKERNPTAELKIADIKKRRCRR